MATHSIQHLTDARILASGAGFALLSASVTDLPNTVLVQLFGMRGRGGRTFSLYTVYREGTMTFDAIMRFRLGEHAVLPAPVLRRFVASAPFRDTVLAPLIEEVRTHFKR